MSEHCINPDDESVDCPCEGVWLSGTPLCQKLKVPTNWPDCKGTGRIPSEAKREIEIVSDWDDDHQHLATEDPEHTRYRWRLINESSIFGDVPLGDNCECGKRICWGHWSPLGTSAEDWLAAAREAQSTQEPPQ